MVGLVLASSYQSFGFNPDVLAEAGLKVPDSSWTWGDMISMAETVKEKTGKYGMANGPVDDTNIFNYVIPGCPARMCSCCRSWRICSM